MHNLLELESKAIELMDASQWAEAVKALQTLLRLSPGWEDGNGSFMLAECYDHLALKEEAKTFYAQAIRECPISIPFLISYAQFLKDIGAPDHEVFEAYLKVAECLLFTYKNISKTEELLPDLFQFGAKLNSLDETKRILDDRLDGIVSRSCK